MDGRSTAVAVDVPNEENHVPKRDAPFAHLAPPLSAKSLLLRHAADWVTFFLLVVLNVGIFFLEPVTIYAGAIELAKENYPQHPGFRMPFFAVLLVAIVGPLLVFLLYFIFKRDSTDLHQSILAFCYTIVLTGAITTGFKVGVGRLRPDFFNRCFPDGHPVFSSDGNAACNGDPKQIVEGRKSFPSGHASWAFAGLGFMALYLAGKLHTFSSGMLWALLPPLLCLAGASTIGVCMILDYVHHADDVIVGSLIGLAMASLCYFLYYPALTRPYSEIPRLSMRKQEE